MLGKRLSTSQRFARLHDLCPKLAEFAQSLFPLLLAHADDHGRQQGDVFTVKHQVHPTSPRSLTDFERALGALHETNLIAWYEAEGRRYVQIVQFDEHQSGLHKRRPSEFPEPPGISGTFPPVPGNPPQEKGRELNGREPELNGTEGKGVVSADADAPLPADPADLMLAWNTFTFLPIPRCKEFSASRRRNALARLRERPMAVWRQVVQRIQASDFCGGQNDRGWIATFDWLLQADTAMKVLEGKYDNRDRAGPAVVIRPGRGASNAAAFDEVAERLEQLHGPENGHPDSERGAEVAGDRPASDGGYGNLRRLPDGRR